MTTQAAMTNTPIRSRKRTRTNSLIQPSRSTARKSRFLLILAQHSISWTNIHSKPCLVHICFVTRQIEFMGSAKPLTILGTFETTVESWNKVTLAKFNVVPGMTGSLLSYATAPELGIVQIINLLNQHHP